MKLNGVFAIVLLGLIVSLDLQATEKFSDFVNRESVEKSTRFDFAQTYNGYRFKVSDIIGSKVKYTKKASQLLEQNIIELKNGKSFYPEEISVFFKKFKIKGSKEKKEENRNDSFTRPPHETNSTRPPHETFSPRPPHETISTRPPHEDKVD